MHGYTSPFNAVRLMHGYTSPFNAVRFDENPFSCQCQKEDKKTYMLKFRTLLVIFM